MTRRGQEWMDEALCAQVDPELFFIEKGGSTAEALRVCQRCPVQIECAAYALASGDYGIWGGTSDNQRRQARGGGRAPRVEKTCVVCGETFRGTPARVTCSQECSDKKYGHARRRKAG